MKNKFLSIVILLVGIVSGCKKDELDPSTVTPLSIPEIVEVYANTSYVFGVGSGLVFNTVPDTIALAVDSVYGFEGGFGGKTGKDSVYIKKSDIKGGWPDTTIAGAGSVTFEKFSLLGYKAVEVINIVVAAPISDPGPTDISGGYVRPSNGITFEIIKVFDGVYVIDNPGGAGVPPYPYLLYDHISSAGIDSLAFPTQSNPCGGGLKLVSPGAPLNLTSATYSAQYPPAITSLAPLTLSWRIFEFPDISAGTVHTGVALCQWGTGARTFVRQ